MSQIFFTSDTHFGHKNILNYNKDDRPFTSVHEMNEWIIESWNAKVGPDDVVYHLGDVAFMQAMELRKLLDRLNGRIKLIRGNHDKVVDSPVVRGRFDWIRSYHTFKIGDTRYVLFHFPIFSWHNMERGAIHLYGHTHGVLPYVHPGWSMDVGMDTNGCMVYSLEDIHWTLASDGRRFNVVRPPARPTP